MLFRLDNVNDGVRLDNVNAGAKLWFSLFCTRSQLLRCTALPHSDFYKKKLHHDFGGGK